MVIINEEFPLTFRSSLSASITMTIVLSDLTYISKREKKSEERRKKGKTGKKRSEDLQQNIAAK